MRHVARVFWSGMAFAGSVDYAELTRWAVSRVFILIGALFIFIGLLVTPLPIPLGLPMIALGAVILLNSSSSAKKTFVRWGRKYPRTVGRIRAWLRANQRAARQRAARERNRSL